MNLRVPRLGLRFAQVSEFTGGMENAAPLFAGPMFEFRAWHARPARLKLKTLAIISITSTHTKLDIQRLSAFMTEWRGLLWL